MSFYRVKSSLESSLSSNSPTRNTGVPGASHSLKSSRFAQPTLMKNKRKASVNFDIKDDLKAQEIVLRDATEVKLGL